MSADASAGDGYDATVSFAEANRLAAASLPFVLLPVVLHAVLWGGESLGAGGLTLVRPWVFFPLMVASVLVHEALHGAGFLAFGRVGRRAVHFGLDRKTFTPFAGSLAPMRASAYRAAVLLPALGLGAAPAAAGLAMGSGAATIWGAFMLLTAGGDFAALWAMRRVPASAKVLDHPERVGCRVVG